MKEIPVEQAVGLVLCHDLTRIVPGKMKGAQFKKGHVITAGDIPLLRSMGKEHVFAAGRMPGMAHEDEAAAFLARLCAGANIEAAAPSEGKIELFAAADGLFEAAAPRINRINELGELALATRRALTAVRKGDKLAAVKAIPLFIAEEKLARAGEIAAEGALLSVTPFAARNACVIATGSEVAKGLIEDAFTPVLEEKLKRCNIRVVSRALSPDGAETILQAIRRAHTVLKESGGPGLILCAGGMSVDPDDNTPAAIRQSGAELVRYGFPLFPGAMCMLAYFEDGTPVVGLPACVMFAKITVFDVILPPLAAGKKLTDSFFSGMGIGGLCLNCPECYYPACMFGNLTSP